MGNRQRKFFRVWPSVLALLVISEGAQGSSTSDPTTPEIANPDLSLPGATGGCGQACLYLKANDLLGMRQLYMQKKAEELIKLREAIGTGTQGPEVQALQNNLKSFCRTQRGIKQNPVWDTDWDQCFSDYLRVVGRSVEVTRLALQKNYTVVNELSGGLAIESAEKSQDDPKTAQKVFKDPTRSELKKLKLYPDFPFLPSLDSLDPILKKLGDTARLRIAQRRSVHGAQAQQQADEALAQWWDQFPRCPARDEFAQVEFVERYPTHPTGEKLPRIVHDKDGKIVIDQAKYQDAMKTCNDKKKQHLSNLPLPDELVADSLTIESRRAFKSAQKEMVDAVEKRVNENLKANKPGAADHVTVLGKVKGAKNSGSDLDSFISNLKNTAAKYGK
ncbi:MAG: hypothetical protein KGQ59_03155 [Bdellovibrionales bacterium]|nr:hypothetical protein [Bdellovibrionales bacterium]